MVLHALEAGKSYVIPGTRHYLLAQVSRFAPRSLTARIAGRLMRLRATATTPIARKS